MTNTSGLVQFHDQIRDPPVDCRSDLWIIYHLGRKLKAFYASSTKLHDAPIQALTWDYPTSGAIAEPDAASVLREISGYIVADRKQAKNFRALKDDGTTACGGWLYSGICPDEHDNKSRSRTPDGRGGPSSHPGWAFAWPGTWRTL